MPPEKANLRRQDKEQNALEGEQMTVVGDLQGALANGDISQEQYDDAIGAMFDQQLTQLAGDFEEQGRPEAAAGVPVGIGVAEGREQRQMQRPGQESPVAPPRGVQFGGRQKPQAPLSGDDALLYGTGTYRPNESVTTPSRSVEVPDEVFNAIPALLEAAKDPDAPPALHALLELLNYQVNG